VFLVLAKSDDRELVKRLGRMVNGLEPLEGVLLVWAPRDKVAKAVDTIKKDVIKKWEEEGKGPMFEVAVIELTETQYKEVRPLAKAIIEKMAQALLEEMERLHEKMRSGDKKVLGWYRDVAARYHRLVDISLALDIEPTIMGRLKDKWKEVSLEAGRLR